MPGCVKSPWHGGWHVVSTQATGTGLSEGAKRTALIGSLLTPVDPSPPPRQCWPVSEVRASIVPEFTPQSE